LISDATSRNKQGFRDAFSIGSAARFECRNGCAGIRASIFQAKLRGTRLNQVLGVQVFDKATARKSSFKLRSGEENSIAPL